MSTAILEAPPAVRDNYADEDSAIDIEEELPKGFEFVDGELRELNVSTLTALVTAEISGALRDYVKPRRCGMILSEAVSYRCFPNDARKQRRADVSYFRLDRLTAEQAGAGGPLSIAPDIAVEVISPNDTGYEVNAKRLEWLRAGVQLVWIVYPIEREVHVYRPDGASILHIEDTLTANPVLPDFSVRVAELFRLPGEEVTV